MMRGLKNDSRSKNSQSKQILSFDVVRLLYRNINGIKISSEYRAKARNGSNKSLTYGEITHKDFLQILAHTKVTTEHPVFVDLGCGTGKAVICAALSSMPFSCCWGIEIVPDLINAASEVQAALHYALDPSPKKSIADLIQPVLLNHDETFVLSTFNTGNEKGTLQPISQGMVTSASVANAVTTKVRSTASPSPECLSDQEFAQALALLIATHTNHKGERIETISDLTNSFCINYSRRVYRSSLYSHGKFTAFLINVKTPEGVPYFDVNDQNIRIAENCEVDSNGAVIKRMLKTESDLFEVSTNIANVSIDSNHSDISGIKTLTKHHNDNQSQSSRTILLDHKRKQGHAKSLKGQEENYKELRRLCQSDTARRVFQTLPKIELTCGDIFEVEWWKEADVAYCANLLFDDAMMGRLSQKVSFMRPGSWFISLRSLPSNPPENLSVPLIITTTDNTAPALIPLLKCESFFKMSWQMAKVYIYQLEWQ